MNDQDTTQQFTGKCVQCGEPITPANNQVQFNRNRGLHMRKRHGVIGSGKAVSTRLAREAAAAAPAPKGRNGKLLLMTPEAIAKREYQKKWRDDHKDQRKTLSAARRAQLDDARQARWAKHRQEAAPASNGSLAATPGQFSAAVPCNLSECPVCHSRFYVVRGA